MRHARTTALLLLALLATGCGSQPLTPLQQATVMSEASTAFRDGVGSLYDHKAIAADDFLAAQPAIKGLEAAVDDMFATAERPDASLPFSPFWQAAQAAAKSYGEGLAIRQAAERKGKRPATRPSVPVMPNGQPAPPVDLPPSPGG